MAEINQPECVGGRDGRGSVTARLTTFQQELSKLPQIEFETKHYFADGMYVREFRMPAQTVTVGKIHRREHIFLVAKGSILIYSDDGGVRRMVAGDIVISQPGTKRGVYAEADSTLVTLHNVGRLAKRGECVLPRIEKRCMMPDETALCDSRNRLKAPQVPKLETVS